MADRVQFILDRLAPSLKRLEQLELFALSEVKQIVKRLTDLEYLIQRRELSTAQYEKYIEYSTSLNKLLSIKALRYCKNASNQKEKKTPIREVLSILIRHTCYVFDRAIRRFPYSLDLWDKYILFLKENKAYNVLSTTLAKAMGLHPKVESFWLQAAAFELDHNNNIHAARVLFQRSLRYNPTNKLLWARYFDLELWNTVRVLERQRLLTIEVDSSLLEGAPVVVFKHALLAIPDAEFACELHQSSVQILGYTANIMEAMIIEQFGLTDEVLSYFVNTRVSLRLSVGLKEIEEQACGKEARARSCLATSASALEEFLQAVTIDYKPNNEEEGQSCERLTALAQLTRAVLEAASQFILDHVLRDISAVELQHLDLVSELNMLQEVLLRIQTYVLELASSLAPLPSADDHSFGRHFALENTVQLCWYKLQQVSSGFGLTSRFDELLSGDANKLNKRSRLMQSPTFPTHCLGWLSEAGRRLEQHVRSVTKLDINVFKTSLKGAPQQRKVDLAAVGSWSEGLRFIFQYSLNRLEGEGESAQLAHADLTAINNLMRRHVNVLLLSTAGMSLLNDFIRMAPLSRSPASDGSLSLMQAIIKSDAQFASLDDRALWALRYLRAVYLETNQIVGLSSVTTGDKERSERHRSVEDAFHWLTNFMTVKPQFSFVDMSNVFAFTLDIVVARLRLDRNSPSGQLYQFGKRVAVFAQARNGDDQAPILTALEALETLAGNHGALEHMQWKRQRV